MGKKIVILNGGPRMNGNTAALINAFTEGAQEAGHTVVRFDLQKMNIHGCMGCCQGGKDKGSPCTQKDDMERIYPDYQAADVVVFASPMYYWTITGQLKCAIDRLYAVVELGPKQEKAAKDCVMLMAAAGNTESNFASTRFYYEDLVRRLGWKDLGMVCAGGNLDMGDIKGKPQLEEARRLGASV